VDGPTLADRLQDGPVPVAEALVIARQLTDALETAHERGIVHRDLKPANVKLSPSGRVVLLDFGLAKEGIGAGPHTSVGVILGTCAYMSPEQARGQPVDKRADIWALGCILFELLSGQRAFPGDTPSDTMAAVLERPPDWTLLPSALRADIRALLRRCLEEDLRRRLHDVADVRIAIEDAQQPEVEPLPPARRRHFPAALAAAGVVALAAIGMAWSRSGGSSGSSVAVTRATWPVPAGLRLESPAVVSPDGHHIAFTASGPGAPPRLYVRPLSGLDARAIPRTDGAMQPFWSPDSRALAYFARGKLVKVTIDGGAPVEICAVPNAKGGAWSRSGVIVFSPNTIYSGLFLVSADGGTPEPATLLDTVQGENAHRWPVFLPDGTHFLYFVRSIVPERRGVYVGSIDGPPSTPGAALFRSESEAIYAPLDDPERGVLMSVAEGHVDVYPFDTRRRRLTGDPITIALPAGGNTPHHASMLSVSADVLAHVGSALPYGDRLASATRTGDSQLLDSTRSIVSWPRISPDGARIALQRLDALTGSPDLWAEHLERGTRVRITEEGTSGQLPVWSPDGTKLAYVAGTFERPVLTIAASDGMGVVGTLPCPRRRCEPSDWSRDGRWLLVTTFEGGTVDVWLVPTETGGTARPLLTEAFVEREGRFSPDGQFVAYVSEEIGRPEISIRTIEGLPRREVVSVGGGTQPVWSRAGNELLFVDPEGTLRSAPFHRTADGRPAVGAAVRVKVPLISTGHYGTQFDVSVDGGRVYFLDRQPGETPREIGLVLGWRGLLK
jgi:Tol biopolymer transport system component